MHPKTTVHPPISVSERQLLSSVLQLLLEALDCPAFRNAHSGPGLGGDVLHLGRIEEETLVLVEDQGATAGLGDLLDSFLGLLVDRLHQLLLLLLKFELD